MRMAADWTAEDPPAVDLCRIFLASALFLAVVQTGSSPLVGRVPLAAERSWPPSQRAPGYHSEGVKGEGKHWWRREGKEGSGGTKRNPLLPSSSQWDHHLLCRGKYYKCFKLIQEGKSYSWIIMLMQILYKYQSSIIACRSFLKAKYDRR